MLEVMDDKTKKNKPSDQETKKLEIEKLRKDAEELKKQADNYKQSLKFSQQEGDNYKNKYLRALADYQNYEKRVREEKNQVQEFAITNILVRLLPFLDHLEKAEVFIKDKGLKMVKDNFEKVLKDIGLEEIQVEGKEFDLHLAEAVEVVEGDKDNVIKGILRKGYMLNGKVIRVAQVRVTNIRI